MLQRIEASVDAIEAGFHFAAEFTGVRFDAVEAMLNASVYFDDAPVDSLEASINLVEASIDVDEAPAHLVEPFVDPVEPLFESLVGPALRHQVQNGTVTRCLHGVARTSSFLCNESRAASAARPERLSPGSGASGAAF